jgi:membrane protein YdbS with pleckstrin-like domain
MPIEPPADPIKTLWQTQPREIDAMPLEQILMKARAFQAKVRRRQLLTGAFAIVVFAIYVYAFPGWMMKTGSVLCILALVNVFWQRHRRTAALRIPEAPADALVDFHRSELVRHRDAVGGSWLWEIVPTLPGLALIVLGHWFQIHAPGVPLALDNVITALGTIIVALILVIVVLVRRFRVYRLQKQIDELDRLRGA